MEKIVTEWIAACDDGHDDPPPMCPVCVIPSGQLLGILGNTTWLRCRMCGVNWSVY